MNLPPCRWPHDDQHARVHVEQGVPLLRQAIELCPRRRLAIQAGGCVGLYPLILAEHFERVWTFEPNPSNFDLMLDNLAGTENVKVYREALSSTRRCDWGLGTFGGNCGAAHLAGRGKIHALPLDACAPDAVDLIQFDVEGHELEALAGARSVILRDRPVVMLEEYGAHATRYGANPDSARKWLQQFGYCEVARSESDVVMVYTSRDQAAGSADGR